MEAVCMSCVQTFFSDPIKMAISIGSIVLAGLFVLALVWCRSLSSTKKLALIYGHIFFLTFPIIFFIYGQACQMTTLSCGMYKSLLYTLPIAFGGAILVSFLFAPVLYKSSLRTTTVPRTHSLSMFIDKHAKKFGIKVPGISIIDDAKPMAYSYSTLRSRIFMSVGLMELLNKKELQAVLLHELAHIRNRTSFFKFSTILYSIISPLARFTPFYQDLDEEEEQADAFAIERQGTDRHILSAKQKINEFERFDKPKHT